MKGLNKKLYIKNMLYLYLGTIILYLLYSYKTLQRYSGKGMSIFFTLFVYIGITLGVVYKTNLYRLSARYYIIGFLAGGLSLSTFLPIHIISFIIGSLVTISFICSVNLLKNQNDIYIIKKDIDIDIVILIILCLVWIFIMGGYGKLIKFAEFSFTKRTIIVLRALAAGISEEIMFRLVLYLILIDNKYLVKFPRLIYLIMVIPFTMSHFIDAIVMGEIINRIPDILYIGIISALFLGILKRRDLLTTIAIHFLIDFFAFI